MKSETRYVWRHSAHRFGVFTGNALVIAVLVVLLYLVIDGPRWTIRLGGETWSVQKVEDAEAQKN
jgi:hypothetical protein